MALRFGLLGTGHWAEHTQGAALAAHPDVELVGVWGRDPGKAARLGATLGAAGFAELDDLLAEVDAVAIAVPPDIQATLATRAARAGKHLFLDKPIALTAQAADDLVAAVEAAGVASVVFFTRRFHPGVRAFLPDAITGHWDGARVTMFGSIFDNGSPYGASRWRRERGGLWDVGPHALSVLLPILGEVVDLVAVAGPHTTSHVLLRHQSGAVSTLALTLDAPAAATAYEFLFYGESGRVSLPDADTSSVTACGLALTELIDNVAAGRTEHPCDVRFGRDVVAVLARADAALHR